MNYSKIYILFCIALSTTLLTAVSVNGQSINKTKKVDFKPSSDVLILSASVHFNFEVEPINQQVEKSSMNTFPAVHYQSEDEDVKRKKLWWIVGGVATLAVGSAAILLTGSDGSSGDYIPVPPGRPIP